MRKYDIVKLSISLVILIGLSIYWIYQLGFELIFEMFIGNIPHSAVNIICAFCAIMITLTLPCVLWWLAMISPEKYDLMSALIYNSIMAILVTIAIRSSNLIIVGILLIVTMIVFIIGINKFFKESKI